ncbi:MAG: tRNA (adenosine(37)-N6)-dimethylallyltransferase MiaA [Ignavibacteriales bacterium]|nr:tRNA (adenosine(37)-N6)-dimethylallyltransferase MiaA [Ignavibacteriales bacterium]
MERKVIVIVGPTCSGKTKLSISLAEKMNGEIISADSRQIYKYLDIGTAKPLPEELRKVKHHFVDCFEPEGDYNVSKFETDALNIIEKLFAENKTPILCGGSGLYIKALVDGIFNTIDVDVEFREELKKNRELFGNEHLYEELKKVDPVSAANMLPQNWKRVMRALEVYHLSGVPIRQFQEIYKRDNVNISFVQFGLNWERQILYKNIEKRVDKMIGDGLVDEVEKILSKGYSKELNSLNTVGYKEIISFLNNEYPLERAIELIKRNTRRFAKRQMTWFRKDERINWIDVTNDKDFSSAESFVRETFGRFEK